METTPPPPAATPTPLPPQESPSPANSNAAVPVTTTPSPAPIVKSESPETAKLTPETTSAATPPSSAANPSPITIPSHSSWFSWSSIHDTEHRLLPDFFDGTSKFRNPETYKYIRDSIIRRCWRNSARKITFTEARRALVADVGSVRRVFDFLEAWGLINYSPPPPKQQGLAKPSGPEQDAAAAAAPEKKEPPGKRVCGSCGAVCSQACFTTDKAELVICSRCFVRGNYRAGLTSGDFKRVDVGDDGGWETKSEWSDKETLHLLEAVYHYGDDWKKVSEHVGNGRSPKDCVIRFLRLPFGEQFMQSEGSRSIGLNSGKENSITGLEREEPESKRMCISPLLDTSNPIMAQVAFLAAMAGSEVAEAAAQAAVASLSDEVRIINGSTERKDKTENGGMTDNDSEQATTRETVEEAVMVALAQLEKEQEEREQSITEIVQIQMKKMQEKIQRFEELELLMEREKLQAQYLKNLLFSDQLSLLHHQIRSKPAGS